jgi:hypothetical protein
MTRTVPLRTTYLTLPAALARVTEALRKIDPRYNARFVPAEDETVDDSIEILLDGKESGWDIQLDADYAVINQWLEEEGAMRHWDCPNLARAIERLPEIIRENHKDR